MVNGTLRFALRGMISCIVLGYLFFKIEWSVTLNVLRSADLNFYLGSTLLAFLGSILLATKYYLLIKGTLLSRSLFSVLKINLISRYYGLLLPSAVGPELVRWYKITRNQGGRVFFLAVTAFERLTFVFLLLLSALIPLLVYSSNPGIAQLRVRLLPFLLLLMALIVVAFSYFISPSLQSSLRRFIEPKLRSKGKWQRVISFLENFSLENRSTSLYGSILALSILWQLFFLGRMFLLFQTLLLPLCFTDVVWMSSLVLLLQILPISIAGIGVREGAYAYLFTLFNLPPEQGALIGILFFFQMLLFALIGWILELLDG